MDESYKLSLERHEAIFKRLEKRMLASSKETDSPRIAILGGQPGAGKSYLIDFAQEHIFPDREPAVINGDDYRMEHPQADQILADDDKKFAARTDPDVRDWTKRLFDSAIAGRRDIIFEGTMRNKGPIMETIQNLHDEGYKVDVLVMAVRGEVSRVGTLARYEGQKEKNKYGRWTPPESHDEAYENMPDTVLAIENKSPIDSMRVYNRAGELLYENTRQDGVYQKPPQTADAKAAIVKERTRPPTQEEQHALSQQRQIVEKRMLARGAAAKEISEAKAIMMGVARKREGLSL